VRSDWVRDEASRALGRGVLVPALIDDTEIPFGFGQLQTCALADWQGEPAHPAFNQLLKAVAELIFTEKPLKQLALVACSQEASLRSSMLETPETRITFVNNSSEAIKIYWIDCRGKRKLMMALNPNDSKRLKTHVTHPFVVADLNERCLGIYLPDKEPGIAMFSGK
jgi:hypothetical protein